MGAVPQTHHGLCVADIDGARATLAALGFTTVQPNAPEPLVYADTPEDEVGRRTCPDLGSPYRTHYVEHPGTGHQIDLIEIAPANLLPRPADGPLSGDLTVTMPLPGADAVQARDALRPLFGERVVVTDTGSPSAVVHLAASVWDACRSFLVDLLGVSIIPAGEGRWMIDGVGGPLDVQVGDAVPLPDGLGKRYEGANHFRFLHRDLAAIDRALPGTPGARWLLPPDRGFSFVAGPGGMTIELFDQAVTR